MNRICPFGPGTFARAGPVVTTGASSIVATTNKSTIGRFTLDTPWRRWKLARSDNLPTAIFNGQHDHRPSSRTSPRLPEMGGKRALRDATEPDPCERRSENDERETPGDEHPGD